MNNNIRKIVNEKGLNMTFIAKKSGICKTSLYAIMNGDNVPSLINARNIARALGVTLDELFPDTEVSDNDK